MNFEQKDFELISDYIHGHLNEEDKRSFESRMRVDEDLRKEVLLHTGISISVKEEGWMHLDHKNNQKGIDHIKEVRRSKEISDLEAKIKGVSNSYFKNKKNKRGNNFKKYFLGVAAAAAICLFIVKMVNVDPSMSGLYQNNVNWDQSLLSKIEQSKTHNDPGQIGESLFKNGEYNKAKELFLGIVSQKENPDTHSLMYLGASYTELEEFDKAIDVFNQLLNQNTLDSNRAYWYKAMVYLKQNNKDAAILELNVLTDNKQNYNYDKAKELLDQLE